MTQSHHGGPAFTQRRRSALPSTEDLARLAALSAKLRSQAPIPSRSEIAVEIDGVREALNLYSHPPQPSASVVEAIAACETVLICAQEMCKAGHPVSALNVATDALRALKGDE